MNLFLDTSNTNFCFFLFNEKNELVFEKNVNGDRRHSELLPTTYYQALTETKTNVSELKNIYLALGPGSYTGMRIGLTFVKTLKLINPDLKIYFIQSPQIYVAANFSGFHTIDARGGFYYISEINNGNLINIKVSSNVSDSNSNLKVSFSDLINHIEKKHFKLENNIFEFKLNYYKSLNFRKLK